MAAKEKHVMYREKKELENILGSIDIELLREQRNHIIKIANCEIAHDDINEDHLDGILNLLDAMLDVLDLETGA